MPRSGPCSLTLFCCPLHPLDTVELKTSPRSLHPGSHSYLVIPARLCACSVTKLCLTLCSPHGLYPTRLLYPCNCPGKNTGVGCRFLPQEIFLIQRLNPHLLRLLRWQADSLPLSHLGSPARPQSILFCGLGPPSYWLWVAAQ